MHVDVTPSDLYRTHRIGQKRVLSNKPRAVIIKFVSCDTRKSYHYRNINSQENGNFEGYKGKPPI